MANGKASLEHAQLGVILSVLSVAHPAETPQLASARAQAKGWLAAAIAEAKRKGKLTEVGWSDRRQLVDLFNPTAVADVAWACLKDDADPETFPNDYEDRGAAPIRAAWAKAHPMATEAQRRSQCWRCELGIPRRPTGSDPGSAADPNIYAFEHPLPPDGYTMPCYASRREKEAEHAE